MKKKLTVTHYFILKATSLLLYFPSCMTCYATSLEQLRNGLPQTSNYCAVIVTKSVIDFISSVPSSSMTLLPTATLNFHKFLRPDRSRRPSSAPSSDNNGRGVAVGQREDFFRVTATVLKKKK